jgi:CubicO group peptidase (beta-lactamase class C family)
VEAIEGLLGAAVVTRDGSIALEAAGGAADAAAGTDCTPRTVFQIASVSKQFAATAVMLLAEDGKVILDEPVQRWFPGCPPPWQQITLHHLLTHTSGIRHWDEAPGFDITEPMDLAKRLTLFQQAPLRTAPGTQWQYSSPGYIVVGQIVEQASGQPYAEFLTERILAPLGLTSTTAGRWPATGAVARGYHDGSPVTLWDLSAMPGTGDICSTVGDLARFSAAVHTGSLLTARSRQALITPHAPFGDTQHSDDGWLDGDGYGYGHYVGSMAGHVAYFHTGDNPGYLSFNAWLPDHQAAIAVLVNDEATSIEQVLRRLLPAAVAR